MPPPMPPRLLDLDGVSELRALALRFGGAHGADKRRALDAAAACAIADPLVLAAYHDCLLCLLAYPESRSLRDRTRAELKRVAATARHLMASGPARARARLANSGIAWTDVTISFGWDIACWLVERFPAHADLDSFGENGIAPQSVLGEALAPMEFELAAAAATPLDFVAEACAVRRGTKLAGLVRAFARLPCSDALRGQLFEALQPFIVIRPGASMLSRTFVRGLPAATFFHRGGLERDVDLRTLLERPLPAPRRLSAAERLHVVDAGRAMLSALGRETDAIALACPDGVRYYELERGVALALYTMRPDRRSPLDSHVGMMIFKNGVPVGYGGGWPFLGTCKIGVNVFAPFRGGESALLFGQVLRVYRQCFGVERFVAEPSQFGGSNKEGLQSGAFWFYYRLGFRPIEPRSAQRAEAAWARMQADPDHRTPVGELRRFTDSDIELRLGALPECEPGVLSDAVTGWIRRDFGGDRAAAERAAIRLAVRALGVRGMERWPAAERDAFRALAPLVALVPGLTRWPATAKRSLVALLRAKGGDEFRFHAGLAQHRRFADALRHLHDEFARA
jgi:hypothetical protein